MPNSPASQFHPLGAIATTPQAVRLLQPLSQSLEATLWIPDSLAPTGQARTYSGPLKNLVAQLWPQYRGLIFCLAAGAVGRTIAPLLQDKSRDPAVVVLDGRGRFAVSLSGGHQGGGDRLALLIAHYLEATPVLTGAAASLGLPGIDILGLPFGWRRGSGDWTGVSAAIARQEKVQVIQEAGSALWQQHLPPGHPFLFQADGSPEVGARVWIGPSRRSLPSGTGLPQVQWHPRVLWLGIGCTRGTSEQFIARAIDRVLERHHLAREAIAGLATIDRKADEVGLLEFCESQQLPLQTFPAAALSQVAVPNPSAAAAAAVGTPSVAEAAAVLAAGTDLTVPKQVIKGESQGEAVTLAIAWATQELTGRQGQLWLVGIGPGSLDQITPAAKAAIGQADVLIGYSLYLELIGPLQRPGQIVETFPITQERERARRAIALARWGLSVAVVSSGDCGTYGMAGLVLEQLEEEGWDGRGPQVQVFPGITAATAAAARVGAPLMQDFCTVSLSDLLVPWEVIERRLAGAAAGDFVTVLYNPRSQRRTEGIVRARAIFLQHRPPHTPVALVRAAYRPEEEAILTTLEQMLDFPIDMMTTAIIGNRSTRRYGTWLINPRAIVSPP